MVAIYPIVEGHGEVRAVPILLRRIATEIFDRHDVFVLPAHRIKRGRMTAEASQDLIKATELGARKIAQTGHDGAVLVIFDADDDCPATIGPLILGRIRRDDVRTSVVVANKEYESWFLAAATSLSRQKNVLDDAKSPPDPEAIRGAKRYLANNILKKGAVYSETVDQPAFTATFGLGEARTTRSFDKLCREIEKIVMV